MCYFCIFTDSKGLSNPGEVEALREKVYASLEAYCKQKYPEQPGRYEDQRRHDDAHMLMESVQSSHRERNQRSQGSQLLFILLSFDAHKAFMRQRLQLLHTVST